MMHQYKGIAPQRYYSILVTHKAIYPPPKHIGMANYTNADASTEDEYYCENCDSHQIFGTEDGWMCVCGDPAPRLSTLFEYNHDEDMFPRQFA